ncbi:ABC-2 type transport system permease protein [Asanoa ferruginea]|uniref:Transport permease protein n=1 Tax=Asanoa ferruginea TaxID=53367 RepID=A0A3D9ZD38_9ACTN|nr:ABC transporter permease [Asanoa ferruginea]REF95326.1 ABC-2 type transport system permease protein [Asanoa ferruginea]GIF48416.1 transport permease protein [Asanoa ferruginea]
MTSAYWAVDNSFALIGRSLRISARNIEALLMAVMLPIMLMLIFVFVFGGAINSGTEYVNYVVPGIIILCAGFGASTTAVSVTHDMVGGIIDRIRSMPVVSSAVLTGHVVASVARNLVAMALVIGVGLLVGWRPAAGFADWLAAIGFLALFMLSISWLAACLGLLVRSVDAAGGATFAITFLPYVSSAFVPVDTLPTWLRGVAEHQPITPIVETTRGLLMGTPIGSSWWIALIWFGGITVVAFGWAALLFQRRTA